MGEREGWGNLFTSGSESRESSKGMSTVYLITQTGKTQGVVAASSRLVKKRWTAALVHNMKETLTGFRN